MSTSLAPRSFLSKTLSNILSLLSTPKALICRFPSPLQQIFLLFTSSLFLRYHLLKTFLPKVAQILVSHSKLSFDSARIEDPDDEFLVMAVKGTLQDAGPFNVTITAPDGLDILIEDVESEELRDARQATEAEEKIRTSFNGVRSALAEVATPDTNVSSIIPFNNKANETSLRRIGIAKLPKIRVKRLQPVTQLDMSTNVSIKDVDGFGTLSERMVSEPTFTMILRGRVALELFGGLLKIDDVIMVKEITMKGMDGLKSVQIQSITVSKGTPDHIELASNVAIFNASDVAVDMGDTRLNLRYEEQIIGSVLLPGLFLRQGTNIIQSRVFFSPSPRNPSAVSAARNLLSRFATGRSSTINIRGDHPRSSTITYLRPALNRLNVSCEMMGVPDPMLTSAVLIVSPRHLLGALAGSAPSRIELSNDFDESMRVLAMNGSVSIDNRVIGVIDVDLSQKPIMISPKSSVMSDNLPLGLRVNASVMKAIVDAAGGVLEVDVKASLVIKIGEYETELDYDRNDVPCSLSF